jgi:uncharacterized protein
MSNYGGDFLWYDLMTTDPEGAKTFYKKVVGWSTQDWTDGPAPYTMWKAGEAMIGGVNQLPEKAQKAGAPPHWLGYVGTPDLEAAFAKMTSLGGQSYIAPTDIPSVGRYAVFADPQGAVLGMYQSDNDPGSPATGPGTIGWNELMTTDLNAAVSFYERLFGWNKIQAMDMGELGIYQMYGRGERMLGGMMKCPPGVPGSAWLYYITVPEIGDALTRVSSNGGQVLNGPQEVPGGGKVAQCLDPQGAAFALYQEGPAQ